MSDFFSRELSIRTDFNAVDAMRRFTASLRFADDPVRPAEGELVRLYDREGNSVRGVVEEVDGMIVHVRPDMATWSSISLAIEGLLPISGNAGGQPYRAQTEGRVPARAHGVQID